MIKRKISVPNTSTSLQAVLTAEVRLAEGQILLEAQTLNIDSSPIYRVGTSKTKNFQKRRAEFEA
jgi:hypothetical protein